MDKKPGEFNAPDRSAGAQEAEIFYDIPILVKHPNCDLEPAILRFGEKEFFCASYPGPEEKSVKLIRNYKYTYSEMASVVIRVRPLHVDIRYVRDCILLFFFFFFKLTRFISFWN